MTIAEPLLRESRASKRRSLRARLVGVASCAGLLLGAGSGLAATDGDTRDVGVEKEPEPKEPRDTHFWVDGGAGYGYLSLNTFVVDNEDGFTAELVPMEADGIAGNLGLGLRFGVFTIGPRGSVMVLRNETAGRRIRELQLWSIDLELGFRIPLHKVEPYFVFGGGYSTFGGLDDAFEGVGDGLNIDGANLRAGVGVDWLPTASFSLGARATGEVLLLSRPAVPLRDLAQPREVGTISEARARVLEGDGSSAGVALAVVVGPGFHF